MQQIVYKDRNLNIMRYTVHFLAFRNVHTKTIR